VTFEDLVLCQQLDDPWRIEAGWPERIRTAVDEAAVKMLPEGIDTRFLWQARGLPMFQEDLMAILSRFGGLDPIDAYGLVSAMALHQDEKVRKGEQAFLEVAARSGFARPHADSLFAIVADGAPLATCKAHAISMAYLAAGLALGG
jgi:DNA polymerase III alpha subunit